MTTTSSSPLDTLKHTALRTEDLLGYVIEQLIVDHNLDEDDPIIGCLDNARRLQVEGLAEHVRGVSYDPAVKVMRVTREAASRLYRYEDGSPVRVSIDEGSRCWTVYPRLDPDLLDPRRRLALIDPAFAEVVADIEGEDG